MDTVTYMEGYNNGYNQGYKDALIWVLECTVDDNYKLQIKDFLKKD